MDEHKYVFSPEVVQRKVNKFNTELVFIFVIKVDSKSNIAKLVEIPFELLSPLDAKAQFANVLAALPGGTCQMSCLMLTAGIYLHEVFCLVIIILSGYIMLLASPVTNKVPEFTRAPLIAVVGACSLGKTATNTLLLNHFSDKVINAYIFNVYFDNIGVY